MSHGPPCAVLPLLVDHQWKTSFCPCGVDPWLSVAQRHWDDFCRCAPLLLATTGGFATGSVQRACLCVASLTCLQVSILLANLVRAQTYVLRMDRPLVESTIRGNSPRSSIYFFFSPARFAMDDAGLQLVYGTNNEKQAHLLSSKTSRKSP